MSESRFRTCKYATEAEERRGIGAPERVPCCRHGEVGLGLEPASALSGWASTFDDEHTLSRMAYKLPSVERCASCPHYAPKSDAATVETPTPAPVETPEPEERIAPEPEPEPTPEPIDAARKPVSPPQPVDAVTEPAPVETVDHGPKRAEAPAKPEPSLVQATGQIGKVTGEYGCAVYGDEIRYDPENYYGRVDRGAEVELVNPCVHMSEFGCEIILVRIRSNRWDSEIGRIGWIQLEATDFSGLPMVPKPDYEPPVAYALRAEAGIEGEVADDDTGASALYADAACYVVDDNFDYLDNGARLQLVDPRIRRDYFGLEVVHVRILSDPDDSVQAGRVGWMRLEDTSFRERKPDGAPSSAGVRSALEPQAKAGDRGVVTTPFGSGFYGTEVRYTPEAYIGRVAKGAELELMEPLIYKNQFGLDIVKVKVISSEYEQEIGFIGWVSLGETDFAGLARAPKPSYSARVLAEMSVEPGTVGTIATESAAMIYDDASCYEDGPFYGEGTRVRLVERMIHLDLFGLQVIQVEVVSNPKGDYGVGRVGWVRLEHVSFATPRPARTPRPIPHIVFDDDTEQPRTGKSCFIATAACGDPDAWEVARLRSFRDRVLLHTAPGRRFVNAYYRLSPPLARFIGTHAALRALVRRTVIRPLVLIVESLHPPS